MRRAIGLALAGTAWIGGSIVTLGLATTVARAEAAEEDTGEILVTARKRSESLNSVPISIGVVSAAEVESKGIVNTSDLIGRLPGLSTSTDLASPGRDFLSLVIRGVGANSGGGDPAAPVFVDGIYQPRLGFDTRYVDIERIEVLKGPQGALFGRNTEGGAVSVVFRRPGPDTRLKLMAEADDFKSFRAQANVSGPIAQGLYAGVSFDVSTTEGYLRNAVIPAQAGRQGTVSADGATSYQGRIALLAQPSERFELYLTADAQEWKGDTGLPGVPRGCECYRVNSSFQIDGVSRNRGLMLNATWKGDGVDVTSLSGYRKLSTSLPFDFDGGADRGPNTHDYRNFQEFYSTELRVASNDSASPVQWLGGLFAFRDKVKSRRAYDLRDFDDMGIGIPTTGLTIDYQNTDVVKKGWAAFGQLSYLVAPQLEITVGARYGHEKVNGVSDAFAVIHPYEIELGGTGSRSTSFGNFTASGSVKYNLAGGGIVYATIAQGARSGGLPLTPASPASFLPYKSEKALNYEVGFKTPLGGGRGNLSAALFHIDIRDQQLTSIMIDDGIAIATTTNAGKSRSRGFELEGSYMVLDGFTLNAAVGYTDAKFKDYVDGTGVQHAGERLRFVPRWSGSAGASYVQEVGGDGTRLRLDLSGRHVGAQTQGYAVLFDPVFKVKGYEIVDASISLIRPDWSLQLFVDNLFDDYIETRVFNTFYFTPDGSRAFSSVLPPRRVGIRYNLSL